MTPLEFYKERIGSKWVVARRTPNILARYGEDVVCISKERLKALDKEYRALFGDPYDKPRAELYLVLRGLLLEHECGGDPDRMAPRWEAARNALEAERNA